MQKINYEICENCRLKNREVLLLNNDEDIIPIDFNVYLKRTWACPFLINLKGYIDCDAFLTDISEVPNECYYYLEQTLK